ncbi:FAD-dependent monooxygenase [Knoellia sp. Soil729]|uniref:FAD-dependent monooxygenase n=1 Tax=Knoellia sp. Soil729 TaxID=1736394 RepID=UPI0006F6EAA1|nr:FAD-dependent monooxygenase [Knoellia sp. Soil729]KRE42693.1 FAD-dependent oxidoreductase [Knoellia sp. Soil729]
MPDVIIVGAGPTGVMLASELRLHGVEVLLLERELEPSPMVRAQGIHARTIEIMEQRGMLDRLLPQGQVHPTDRFFAGIQPSEPVRLDTTHPYVLGIPQPEVEKVLMERAVELGVEVRRGCEVVGVHEGRDGAGVELVGGERLQARFVVGCDGGRSTVRKALGIEFAGEPATSGWILGEVELTATTEEVSAITKRVRETHKGFGIVPRDGGVFSVVTPADPPSDDTPPPTIDELRAQLTAYAGSDLGAHSPRWLSRFGDATRLAEHYRRGSVLIAGDAAHVHPPQGGQGLNLGIQDAFNLGWKLAAAVRGWSPRGLLDTYESERRPVAAEVLTLTRAQALLQSAEPGPRAVRSLLAELMELPGVHRHLIDKVTSLGIWYAVGEGELLGQRSRDIAFTGGRRLYPLLRSGRGVLVDQTGSLTVSGWHDRVDVLAERSDELDPPAVLLRPDGHIVWVGDDESDLEEALLRWFGASLSGPAAANGA